MSDFGFAAAERAAKEKMIERNEQLQARIEKLKIALLATQEYCAYSDYWETPNTIVETRTHIAALVQAALEGKTDEI